MEKKIARCKRPERNIFRSRLVNKFVFSQMGLIYILVVSLSSFAQEFVQERLGARSAIIIVMIILIGFATYWLSEKSKEEEDNSIPIIFTTRYFLGPYSAEKLDEALSDKSTKEAIEGSLLKRTEEIKYLTKMIKISACGHKPKRGICLVGDSGCGKSFLLREVKRELDRENYYVIIKNHYGKGEKALRDDDSQNESKQGVVIFDQFERALQNEEKQEVIEEIKGQAKNGNVCIFSIRSEFLNSFIELINLNHLLSAGEWRSRSLALVQCCKNLVKSEPAETEKDSWVFANYLLFESGPGQTDDEAMLEKCNAAFMEFYAGDHKGEEIYEKIKELPLIEQQIVLYMCEAEANPKNILYSMNTIHKLKESDFTGITKSYYDIQLCSCGNFSLASRIMYLLAKAHLHNVECSTEMICAAVCFWRDSLRSGTVDGGEGSGDKSEVTCVLENLKNKGLVASRNHGKSNHCYEMSHDFIAQSFESYADAEISRDVRTSLDDFYKRYITPSKGENKVKTNKNENSYSSFYSKYMEKNESDSWTYIICLVAVVVALFRWMFGIVYSVCPDNTPIKNIQLVEFAFSEKVPPVVLMLVIFSCIYIYCFYRNITNNYWITYLSSPTHKKLKPLFVSILYILTIVSGTFAIFCVGQWLLLLGLGNCLNGVACCIIGKDKKVAKNGRTLFWEYGWRVVLMGVLLMLLWILLQGFSTEIVLGFDLKALMQEVALGTLLIYGFHRHMNQEFFYTHLEPLLYPQPAVKNPLVLDNRALSEADCSSGSLPSESLR